MFPSFNSQRFIIHNGSGALLIFQNFTQTKTQKMKKIFLAFTATSALLLSVITQAHTQPKDAVASANTGKTPGDASTFKSIGSTISTTNAKSSKMASRAVKDFQKSFKNVANANWFATAEGGFVASFKENEIKNGVYYNNNGRWMHTIKRYSEQQLPKSIRHMVKSTYYDYDIICAEEIEVNQQVIFLVHVKGKNNSKTIRISDDEMEVIEDLTN